MTGLKKFPNAIVSHRRALKLEPENETLQKNMVQTLLAAGVALKGKKQFKEAMACYQEALKLIPKEALIWIGLGTLMLVFDIAIAPLSSTVSEI